MSSDRTGPDRAEGGPVPPLLLERLAKDELPEPKKTEVLERLKREPGGMERLAELRASDEAILSEIPPARFRLELDTALGRKTTPRWLTYGLPAAALAAALIALLPVGAPPDPDSVIEATRLKGERGPRLGVLRDGVRLVSGDTARAGDVLSFVVSAGESVFGVLLAIDGAGTVTLVEPGEVGPAIAIEPGSALPGSYELDAAPSFERFFLVTTDQTFDVATVLAAARRWSGEGELNLPPSFQQDTFEVVKPP